MFPEVFERNYFGFCHLKYLRFLRYFYYTRNPVPILGHLQFPDSIYRCRLFKADTHIIKFGTDNISFISDLGNYLLPFIEGKNDLGEISIKMILHGIEDVSVELGLGFVVDFMALLNAFSEIGGIPYLNEANATTMKINY